MALIPIRVDRTSKPPLGTPLRSDGHWSVQGLGGAWAFNEGAGNSVFDSTGRVGWRPITSYLHPNGLANTSTGQQFYFTAPAYMQAPELTLVWAGTVLGDGVTNDNPGLIGISHHDSDSNPYFSAQLGRTAVQSSIYLQWNDNGVYRAGVIPNAIVYGRPTVYVMVVRSGACKVYISGIESYFNNSASTITYGTSPRFGVGGSLFVPSQNLNCLTSFAGMFTSPKSPDQIASLSTNPWQIYEPETVWVEVGAVGEFTGFYAAAQPAQSQSIISSLGFAGDSAQSQPIQSEIVNAMLQFSGGTEQVQAANSAALLAALSFVGSGLQTQGSQGQSLPSSLTFAGSAEQPQPNQSVNAAASLGFSGFAAQSQAQQAQAIYQSLVGITGAVSQTQAAQIASLSAALIFGGSSEQTQTAQIEALAAVLAFAGSTSQGQEAQTEALAALLSFGGEIDQAQAIQIEALTAILAAMDITGTVEQVQARQLQAASDFVAQVHAILRVTASDPLALTISVRDPLALRVTVQ